MRKYSQECANGKAFGTRKEMRAGIESVDIFARRRTRH